PREPLTIAVHRLAVHGDITRLARLRVVEPEIAREVGVQLAGIEHVRDVHVEPPLEQRADAGLESLGIEEIRDDHPEPRLPSAQGIPPERLVEPCRTARSHVGEKIEQRDDLVAPTRGRPALSGTLTEDPNPDPLVTHEADEAERRGDTNRIRELGG